jgi:1,4-dihydroxy-6-naphthoate synthase
MLLGTPWPSVRKATDLRFSHNRLTKLPTLLVSSSLVKIMDLGEHWEQTTGLPIPLGGIVVHRSLPVEDQAKINRVMRRSVEYAFAHPTEVMPFVRAHAQAMEDAVMQAHIDLYVSPFTVDLGTRGRAAILEMFRIAEAQQIIPNYDKKIFLN